MLTQDIPFEQTRNLIVVRMPMAHLTGLEMMELTEEMSRRVRCDNAQLFVLDMKNVTFMDSAGIGALVTFLQDLAHVHGRLGLASCKPNVEFLFKVTRLDAAISLFEDVDEAMTEWL